MYRETNKKQLIIDVEKITIAEYLRIFLIELAKKEGQEVEVKSRFQAERIKGLIPDNEIFRALADFRTGYPYWHKQEVDFVPSNLGKSCFGKDRGFIFYFVCNGCGKRRKDLYYPSMVDEPLCRVCCRLQYKQPNRKTRSLSRIVNKPYFSTDDKYTLMKRLEVGKDDIKNYLSDSEVKSDNSNDHGKSR